jgi:hypothetical protein
MVNANYLAEFFDSIFENEINDKEIKLNTQIEKVASATLACDGANDADLEIIRVRETDKLGAMRISFQHELHEMQLDANMIIQSL